MRREMRKGKCWENGEKSKRTIVLTVWKERGMRKKEEEKVD